MSVIESIRAAFEYQGKADCSSCYSSNNQIYTYIPDFPFSDLDLTFLLNYMIQIGQKCSALSRLYVPKSLWTAKNGFKDILVEECDKITVGPVTEFQHFMTPVM